MSATIPGPTTAATSLVRVLVVDDSAYVRKMVTQMLSRSPFVEVVATAHDGREALELAERLKPDVITCDLTMPEMGGVQFVQTQMSRAAIPIVIMSIANRAGEEVLAALDAGAIDFVQKPTALASDRLLDVADELLDKVKAAARASVRVAPEPGAPPMPIAMPRRATSSVDVVVIGISTGGPQGLKVLIPRLPADLPVPVAIVLHMPVGYTEMYARKLDELSALHVSEAQQGDEVAAGRILLAPAGRHLTFRRRERGVTAHLDLRPLDMPHRPAVDVLFQSAAEVYGARTLGVVMTGMGSDGREGSAWIKARGGRILTEAEESCVVYGMPRSVVEAGLSDSSFTIDNMAAAILDRL